ncbi:sugar transferase [Liquorilactobacillus vini]|uniref:Beta-1,6-galactofuranosyltransferase n=1 Tax=Liquorilactobacillus vini DSM 20605 TaxID=1133569 RepID=A0A0R2CPE4_9LACO|nr:sugar transferase [Liquorilactobacillus vini]KRM89667.1 beta-1,6-galactofuranosyltransferase [Liquorilactobacillus vini DSM 20605]
MNSKKLVVAMYNQGQNEAGPKAKCDIEKFLTTAGFQQVNFHFQGNRKAKLMSFKQSWWDIPRTFAQITADQVFFQYPAFNWRTNWAILRAAKKIATQVFLIIHDVESLRQQQLNQTYLQQEINFFNQANGLIVHNSKMKTWLSHQGVLVPMIDLQIFDYDNPQPFVELPYRGSLCYAGNLAKAGFIQNLKLHHQFYLYGSNPAASYPTKISYQGSFLPDELPAHLKGDFGLIWDGDRVDRCSGIFGEYLKYNDPHKTSLYLSSGLPVIIWRQAALADFVSQQQVGLLVDRLDQIDSLLDKLTVAEYQRLRQNAQQIGRKMRQGQFIKTACQQILTV